MFNARTYYHDDIKVVYILCYRLVCILIRFVTVDLLFLTRIFFFFILNINEEGKKTFAIFVTFYLRPATHTILQQLVI